MEKSSGRSDKTTGGTPITHGAQWLDRLHHCSPVGVLSGRRGYKL
jgi:hypothetical protein